MKKFYLIICLCLHSLYVIPANANQNSSLENAVSCSSVESEAQAALQYFLTEVELDATLSREEQQDKIQEFTMFADHLSSPVASQLTEFLIEETRSRIVDMLHNASLDSLEIDAYLNGYEQAVLNVQGLNVEIAREMLFFVAELKIHRQYVYDFGVALGCPEKQLLRHDLCKLHADQFEGYARYFRGGRQAEDQPRYLAAWELHQHEEHHYQSYSKEGFSFDDFSEERLRNNMLETVADLLAANKQRGDETLINYLVNIFPKQNPHPCLLPFLEDALKKAHALHLQSEENLNSEYHFFQGLPCWNQEVEEVFKTLKTANKINTKPYRVGELGAEWQFPSDHLPVGASIDDIHFALWNTLNTKYLHWIEKNEQGLKNSLIMSSNIPLPGNSNLTLREAIVLVFITKMLNHPEHSRSVLALQEMGEGLLKELSRCLPNYMHVIPEDAAKQKIEDIFLVDTRVFDILDSEISKYTFSRNTIMTLRLREKASGLKYCFIQSHVPGGPVNSVPARIEFSNKIMQEYSLDHAIVVLGDMNRSPDFFLSQFEEAAKERGLANQPFVNVEIPYPTHINTHMQASWIDNIFIANPRLQSEIPVANEGFELFDELQPTLDLLKRLRPQ